MAEFSLAPRSPLDGIRLAIADTTIAEVTGWAVVAVSAKSGSEAALEQALARAYRTTWPEPGTSSLSADGDAMLVGLRRDQILILREDTELRCEQAIADFVGRSGYCTDQSDGWVQLLLAGTLAVAALERIAMIDLHIDRFPVGTIAQTVMDHVDVIVVRREPARFLLLGARSSARSLLHAVETSVRNVA